MGSSKTITTLLLFTAATAAILTGCDEPTEAPADSGVLDAAVDAGASCTSNADCDDMLFCNGAETCDPLSSTADSRGCVAGNPSCAAPSTCDETSDRCVNMGCEQPDADMDGENRIECGGRDCDDNDPNRYPGNTERCFGSNGAPDPSVATHDEDCDPCTVATGSIADGDRDADTFISSACSNPFDATAPTPQCNIGALSVDPLLAVVAGRDCNDDPLMGGQNVRPNQTEACNGIDDNCDGLSDEGLTTVTYFPDCDRDSFGTTTGSVRECQAPSSPPAACLTGNWVTNGDDCDDGNPTVNPSAVEVCADNIDNNCDNYTDTEAPGQPSLNCSCTSVGQSRACGGGMVNAAPAICRRGTQSCQAGGSYSACSGNVDPASDEFCNNGLDDDCDGTVDEAPGNAPSYWIDRDRDGQGDMNSAAVALCSPQPGYVQNNTDCDDSRADVYLGAPEVCRVEDQGGQRRPVDNNCNGIADEGDPAAEAWCRGRMNVTPSSRCNPAAGASFDTACTDTSCREGFDNCDQNDTNGCETQLGPGNCGGCGATCGEFGGQRIGDAICRFDNMNQQWSCQACPVDRRDCDSDQTTCETDVSASPNCGSCNTECFGGDMCVFDSPGQQYECRPF